VRGPAMADQTPDPAAWSDDQLDNLLDALAERAAERDDLDLPGSGASRRSVLAGLLGLGGATAGAGVASAIGENESYGSASGVAGTDSEPLSEANVQDFHAQDAQIDTSLEANRITTAGLAFLPKSSITVTDVSNGVAEVEVQFTPNTSGNLLIIDIVQTANLSGRIGEEHQATVRIQLNYGSDSNFRLNTSVRGNGLTVSNTSFDTSTDTVSFEVSSSAGGFSAGNISARLIQ